MSQQTACALKVGSEITAILGPHINVQDIFSEEKTKACQQMLDEEAARFFKNAQDEVMVIERLEQGLDNEYDYADFCRSVTEPVSALKSRASFSGFLLVARLCGYILDFCHNAHVQYPSDMDRFIMIQLVSALKRSVYERITDAGGFMEQELVNTLTRVHSHRDSA